MERPGDPKKGSRTMKFLRCTILSYLLALAAAPLLRADITGAPNPGGTRAGAPRKIAPSGRVEPSILESLFRSNQAARELIYKASEYDVNRVRFKNPFIPMLRSPSERGWKSSRSTRVATCSK